ncbi:MAG: BMC domain-containing protein [bacterium]|jgi:microcompartment protein CcmL/EutN
MGRALGLIEYKSIARGVAACDRMLKAGNVELLVATVLCPGKFIALVSGDVEAVKFAVKKGIEYDPPFVIADLVLPQVHASVFPALTATTAFTPKGALGIFETIDAASGIIAGDTAAKAANVNLLEIRLARGMGGKTYVSLCGELASVEAAVRSVEAKLKNEGVLVATAIIPSPHRQLTF